MIRSCVICCVLFGLSARAADVQLSDLRVDGTVSGENLAFTLACTAIGNRVGATLALLPNDVALAEIPTADDWSLGFDPGSRQFVLRVAAANVPVQVELKLLARGTPLDENSRWHGTTIGLPEATRCDVTVHAQDATQQLQLDALLGSESRQDGKLVVTGVLPPAKPLQLRWTTTEVLLEDEAELLASSEANIMMTVSPGALRLDAVYGFRITQGKMERLDFAIPANVSITQVRGGNIRDWRLEPQDGGTRLIVMLNQVQRESYALQILGEMLLPQLPVDFDMPVLQPLIGTRAHGFLAVTTSSAIQLSSKRTTGLSQIDRTAFSRIPFDPANPRPTPAERGFFFSFAATPYELQMGLTDIVPSFDVDQRLMLNAKDDDLSISVEVEVDVRDAPIRRLTLSFPSQFIAAEVGGPQVADYGINESTDSNRLVLEFAQPIMGRTVVSARFELGRSPLGTEMALSGFEVSGARNQRGFIVLTTDEGVQVRDPQIEGLRSVHTRSLPVRVAGAEYAWRFREPGWQLLLPIMEMPAAVKAEAFHLLSLGDGIAYGSVVVTYVISGAPLSELKFRVPEGLRDVEFVGLDVNAWSQENDVWTVRLRRKIIGDYNLGVTYSRRYADGGELLAGGIECVDVESQTGYISIASHLNLRIEDAEIEETLIPISNEEIPSQYRLLTSSPVLRSYKYVQTPHQVHTSISSYGRGETPAVIVEFINAKTDLSLNEHGETESVTRVRYTVKNSTAQFLDIDVPEGQDIWATRLVTIDDAGNEQSERLPASNDGGVLKVPLRRQLNPNTPLIIEVEYGQVHGRIGWSGLMHLSLPACVVRATFADWTVNAPAKWAVQPAADTPQGNLATRPGRLPYLLRQVTAGWSRVAQRAFIAFIVVLIVALPLAIFAGRWGRLAATILILAALALGGALAADRAMHLALTPAPQTTTFTQVLDLDTQQPVAIAVQVRPAWRVDFSIVFTVFVGLLALLAAVVAVRVRALRLPALAAALALGAAILAQTPATAELLVHGCTWLLPAVLLLFFIGRGLRMLRRVAALLAVGLGLSLTAAEAIPATPLTSVSCQLTEAHHGVIAELRLRVDAAHLLQVPLAPDTAVLLSEPQVDAVRVRRQEGQWLAHLPAGSHDVTVRFGLPLAKTSFSLALPLALSNQVTFEKEGAGWNIETPDAISRSAEEKDGKTLVSAVFKTGAPAQFIWQPRSRRTELEETVFYANVTSLARADNGLVEIVHRVDLRIAQGELLHLTFACPDDVTVTRVAGEGINSWRFDPEQRTVDVRFAQPLTEDYQLAVVTQIAAEHMPYTAHLRPLTVADAARQRGGIGLTSSPSVFMTVGAHPRDMNIEDFVRDAAWALEMAGGNITHAYRFSDPETSVTLEVTEVTPELRVVEHAGFSVGDDRLVYTAELAVQIAKAGLFFIDLQLPRNFDIDSLAGPQISHWDEELTDDGRQVRVHLKQKMTGEVKVTVALSQPASEVATELRVPRIDVVEALKHQGELVVSAARGVRLTPTARHGVSELDVAELGLREKPALAFKLLRPDWLLTLSREVLQPRLTVEFLHLADITEGLVRHQHFLRFDIHNAGVKVLTVRLPEDVLGLTVHGPEIARQERVEGDPRLWRVELAGKWFGQVYPMQISYETRFDPSAPAVTVSGIDSADADMERGFIAVRTSNRVEIVPGEIAQTLRPVDARSVPGRFGAGDLSDAAFCYRSSAADYQLNFEAVRHEEASLLQAEIESVTMISVVNRQGDSLHHVKLALNSSGKRHLVTTLPAGAEVWSLMVNRQACALSLTAATGQSVLMVPLPRNSGVALPVQVELLYVIPGPKDWRATAPRLPGPTFDLPLRNISWSVYLPEGFEYDDFVGTLSLDRDAARVARHTFDSYRTQNRLSNIADLQRAVVLQREGLELAKQGQQKAARQYLLDATNYSSNDVALNEDARVNLRNLMKQQAVVGLVGRRQDLRRQQADGDNAPQIGDEFTQDEADRLQSALSKDDSGNLDRITNRFIELQEAAAGVEPQLLVSVPLHGRVVKFQRSLQVQADDPMWVGCEASPKSARSASTLGYIVGLFAVLVLILAIVNRLAAASSFKARVITAAA